MKVCILYYADVLYNGDKYKAIVIADDCLDVEQGQWKYLCQTDSKIGWVFSNIHVFRNAARLIERMDKDKYYKFFSEKDVIRIYHCSMKHAIKQLFR